LLNTIVSAMIALAAIRPIRPGFATSSLDLFGALFAFTRDLRLLILEIASAHSFDRAKADPKECDQQKSASHFRSLPTKTDTRVQLVLRRGDCKRYPKKKECIT